MSPLAAIKPSEVLHLWHSQPRHNEHSRVIAFSNALERHLLRAVRALEDRRTPLSELNLRTGVYNALRRAGYSYIDEIEHLPPQELLLVNHVGKASVYYIQEALTNWRCSVMIGEHHTEPGPISVGVSRLVDPREQLECLITAFYPWSSDPERMSALLLSAADIAEGDGPERLRSLAMALVDSKEHAGLAEVRA